MATVGLAPVEPKREASLARCAGPDNSVLKGIRRFWLGLRGLGAELFAFPISIRRVDNNLIVTADLPGLKKEELRVELTGDLLVIEAEPNREKETYFRRGGRRIIALPDGTAIDRARAEMKNGTLTVSVPLSDRNQSRKVPVEEVEEVIDIGPTR